MCVHQLCTEESKVSKLRLETIQRSGIQVSSYADVVYNTLSTSYIALCTDALKLD